MRSQRLSPVLNLILYGQCYWTGAMPFNTFTIFIIVEHGRLSAFTVTRSPVMPMPSVPVVPMPTATTVQVVRQCSMEDKLHSLAKPYSDITSSFRWLQSLLMDGTHHAED